MYTLIRHSVWTDDWQMTKNNRNVPPGLMQYKVSQEIILSLLPNGTKNINCVYNKDWSFAQHTLENLQKLTPNTKTGKANKWKIILISCHRRLHRTSLRSRCPLGYKLAIHP